MRNIYIALLLILVTSCGSKKNNFFAGGSLKQTEFYEKIPFVFNNDWPYITVEINVKKYNFLLDTGAPTVISKELFAELNLEINYNGKVADSHGGVQTEKFVVIPSIKLGNLEFLNSGAIMMDINKTFEFRCLHFDGILGASQMSKAVWQIDYKNQELTVTDNIDKLDIKNSDAVLNFIPKGSQKTPLIKVTIENKSTYLTYDTGFGGSIGLPFSEFDDVIKNYEKIETEGFSNLGIYNKNDNAKGMIARVPEIKFDSLSVKNNVFAFSNSRLIGNNFLKNYTTILDWKTSKIYLKKHTESEEKTYESIGFKFRFVENKPTVIEVLSTVKDIKIGDKILSINELDFTNLTEEEACEFSRNAIYKKIKKATVVYEREGEKHTIEIEKKTYFE